MCDLVFAWHLANFYWFLNSDSKLSFSFHSLLSFSLCIFSYPLYFSLLFCLLSLTQFFKIAPILSLTCRDFSFLWGFTSSPPREFTSSAHLHWPNGLSIYFFIFSFFSPFHSLHIKSQYMEATYFDFASTKISFFSSHWLNVLACFFSFFLPACLTSLTSHIHLCGLAFVHRFINVARLLYKIIEEKMNPIVLIRTSYSSKPISLCWLLFTCPTSSFNELRQIVGWNMVQRTQKSPPPAHCGGDLRFNSSVRIHFG